MTKHNHVQLIQDVTEALLGSVPKRRHEDVLGALKRCQELIGNLSAAVLDLDKQRMHGELMIEAKLYANVLSGFFDDAGRDWLDLEKGYNPRDYLTSKGAIKSTNPTRVQMEEQFVAARKAQQAEIDRLIAENDRKREARKVSATTKALIKAGAPKHLLVDAYIKPLIEPASKRGRPVGSKNKPKTGIVSKVNAILKANKKGAHK